MVIWISIIIPVYNRSDYLRMTLESIKQQTINNGKFEVIIVDDGSEEDIESVVKCYQEFLNLIYFRKSRNGFGAAAARNIGISNSKGNILLFIDNGIILDNRALEKHIFSHELHTRAVVIGYVYGFDSTNKKDKQIKQIVDSNTVEKAIALMESEKLLDTREKMYKKYGDNLNKWIAPWLVCWSCHISIEKSVLERIGMFDESFSTWGGEDIEFALALYVNSVEFVLDRECKSIHYPHEKYLNQVSKEFFDKENMKKKLYLLKKYPIYSVRKWCQYGMSKVNDCGYAYEECVYKEDDGKISEQSNYIK